MPDISAFRGIRYDLGHVGSLSNVIAPPYDVIDAELQQQLYDKHPANVVRLILNKDEPGDDEHNNRYTRAARLMRAWQREGVLFTEADPGDLRLPPGVQRRRRRRTRAAASCAACGWSGSAKATSIRTKKRTARRRPIGSSCGARARRTSARSSACFPTPRTSAEHSGNGDRRRRAARSDRPPGRRPSHLAGDRCQRRSPLSSAAMGDRPVYIADGHHRYETACNLRDQIAAEHGRARRERSRPSTPPTTC